jgi:predicted ABC-type ATPase
VKPRHWFILVGGINGAGKSTFAQSQPVLEVLRGEVGSEIEIINPDLVTRQLAKEMPEAPERVLNLAAAEFCEARVRSALEERKTSISIETVLSTDKYKPIIRLARRRGYAVLFVYVLLPSVSVAIARVAHRVKKGGHNVPARKVRSRWKRSLANVAWFWGCADRAFVFDNGSKTPILVAQRDSELTAFNHLAPRPPKAIGLSTIWPKPSRPTKK